MFPDMNAGADSRMVLHGNLVFHLSFQVTEDSPSQAHVEAKDHVLQCLTSDALPGLQSPPLQAL